MTSVDLPVVYPGVAARRSPITRRTLLGLLDFLTLVVASVGVMLLMQGGQLPGGEKVASVLTLDLVSMMILASQRLYVGRVSALRAVEMARLARAVILAAVSGIAIDRAFGSFSSGEEVVLRAAAAFVGLVAMRGVFRSWLQSHRRRDDSRFTRPVIIVGTPQEGSELYRLMRMHPELGYRVRGFVGPVVPQLTVETAWLADVAEVGDLSQTTEVLRRTRATGALVAANGIPTQELNRVVRDLLKERVHVQLSVGLTGIHHRRVVPHRLAYEPFLYLEQATLAPWQLGLKQAMDVTLGSAALVLSLPVFAIASLAIKLYDRGPVLFRQQRIGRNGKPFTMLKLRTMSTDAEQRLAEYQPLNHRTDGPLFKLADDPRVTPVGKLLRLTSLDELPQLLNVLQGSMSLVGPRPALPIEVDQFEAKLVESRRQVRPGMTGLWQVEARDDPSFEQYARFDTFYVENWSVLVDLAIIFETVEKVMARPFQVLGRSRRSRAAGSSTVGG